MKTGTKKIWVTLATLAVLCGIAFVVLLKSVTSSAVQLDEDVLNQSIVNSPNVKLGNQVKISADLFGGKFMYKQMKDVDGYIIPWSDVYASYTNSGDNWYQGNAMSETNGTTEFAENTNQKMMYFYKPDGSYPSVANELEGLTGNTNKVMEVAISFDRPYDLQEVVDFLPTNLNVAWFWLEAENTNELLDMAQVYGFEGLQKPISGVNDKEVYAANYSNFLAGLDKLQNKTSKMADMYAKYSELNWNEVQVKGIIVTGQEKNFKTIANHKIIRASEIGATADIVPYIKPYK
ncbi:anti sigma factor C-terminal domain-containing protein [Listeria booriae]|uniref:Sigma factor regulator C-terminal domain-containing protein n=1 Tax=Listeria booriae TaxID=1552123 RepID=A0A7X0TP34_9LIST|nr:anti sigma factor C-terminal domain-containing protein [Listeria booriae]MBC1308281.1 hypothetical protein [Listeria booriae]MBC1332407.1 hypothetical protein [Listeria booriae]MBC2387807.1 hypothetical protein [Listeria booriae]